MATFSELKLKVIRLLGDEQDLTSAIVAGSDFGADLLKDSIHAALDAILPWCWKRATFDLDASTDTFELPTDFVQVEAVWDNDTDLFLAPAILTPGDLDVSAAGNSWIEYPEGSLTLFAALTSGGGLLYYAASWTKPSADKDTIEAPTFIHTGLCLYAASYCLLQKSSLAGSLAQYKRRMDSGTPSDNPLTDLSTYFLKRFDVEMGRIPNRVKGMQ